MAVDWIKMRVDLQTHPKVVRIMSALRADRFRAIGGLHAVWCLFDAHSEDGQLDGYTPETLDAMIGWPGFADAMVAVDWLIVGDGFLALPRFDEHNGKSAKRRASETQRKREERAQAVGDLSASDADKKRSREEKRREELSDEANASSSSPRATKGRPQVPCQYEAIVEAYHEALPMLPRVKLMDDKRKAAMRKLWAWVLSTKKPDGTPRATSGDEAVQWFRDYFTRAAGNAWLTGQEPSRSHPGWKADLDFLLTDRGMKAVIERTEAAA